MAKRKNPAAVALGTQGGKKRATTLSPKARKASAQKAARARWAKRKANA